ncbi:MAG: hypothetical protein AB7P20_24485 [Rhizobiaceae bacterium]
MTTVPASTTFGRLWRRWWFHLSALMILVPLWFLKSYIDAQAMLLHADETDMRTVSVVVGPWSLKLQEKAADEPFWHPGEGYEKSFWVVSCPACVDQIRSIHVGLKRPGSTAFEDNEAGGNPHRLLADMKIRRNPSGDDMVWITAEGWDGVRYQAKLPLASASPVTADWAERQSASRSGN